MSLTPYHAKLFAHELTRRAPSDSVEKLATALSDAQVDLNPHQIEAALFAFRSPLSKGAILADEVGLGKTIEAGILLAQRWAERRRRLLVICPANLRKQWSQELADKFFLPTAILEAKTFSESVRKGNLNPFEQPKIVICSYQFARAKEPYIRQTAWDLVVIDEAHRLRNVYKSGNKIGTAIKSSLANRQKVLLTATPLQNSLDELYGLVSIVDEFTFGDLRSFRSQFKKAAQARPMTQQQLQTVAEHPAQHPQMQASVVYSDSLLPLKERLKPLCQRTLRKQVLQYVAYTKRHALVQEFVPSNEEQRLYNLVSEYLQQPNLYALPSSQRQLMTLMLRKLLASSTYAISDTLAGLARKLETAEQESEAAAIPPEFAENFELLPELEEEWAEDDEDSESGEGEAKKPAVLTPEQREERREEISRLREFHELARSIHRNSKGEQLLTALKRGFAAAQEAQAGQSGTLQQKAIIFTESRRTQEYLYRLLEQTEFAGKTVLFNGTNTDEGSQRIYRKWLQRHRGTERISGSMTADKRAALVEYFRDEASVMIATEAAAEGINLQFCNLIVNYDLPWNPQRIEQRIGRCHRYGQKFDVVVVNFLNKANAADMRVYQLLAEKFQLFDGVFGASDEVLGAIESGVDFEKRIAGIYQRCRTPEQISLQFNELQGELESEIGTARANAQEQLLNNFDQEVIEKVRIGSAATLDRFHALLWRVTQFSLAQYADFSASGHSFTLRQNPYPQQLSEPVLTGRYEMRKGVEDANTWRIGHPLAQCMLSEACQLPTPAAEMVFRLSDNPTRMAALEPLKGQGGWLTASLLTLQSAETHDHLLFAGVCCEDETLDGSPLFGSAGAPLEPAQCRRLFDLSQATIHTQGTLLLQSRTHQETLDALLNAEQERVVAQSNAENGSWLDAESAKLDRWVEDRRLMLEDELRELDEKIRETRKLAIAAGMLQQKIELNQEVARLETERSRKRRDLFEAQDRVENERHTLFAEASRRLIQQASSKPLFTIRWRVE